MFNKRLKILTPLLAAFLALALSACAGKTTPGLKPSTYTGVGRGYGGDIEIQLSVDGAGVITDIKVISESESPDYAAEALARLPAAIIEKQSLGLDAVSGATFSSIGILAAAADAITKAGGDPKAYGFVSAAEKAEGAEISFTGLPGGDFTLTGRQLKNDFEVTELDAVSINSKGTEKQVRARGVLLETVLKERGLSQADFDSAAVSAPDGYAISVPGSVLRARDILIAFEINGEPLDFPRLVVPEERAMYWIKNLRSIDFSGYGQAQAEEQPVTREISLGDLIERLKDRAEEYKYYDEICKALPISLLLNEIYAPKTANIIIKSADSLTRTEKYETFAAQLLVFEGTEAAPLYTGPELPAGMRVKNVVSFQIGGVLVKM